MALTTHVSQTDQTRTPYSIDPEQALKASQALLRHIQAEIQKIQDSGVTKKNLLADGDGEEVDDQSQGQPIWLNLATKQYITDKHRLKPSRIPVPHSLNRSENSTICLITTDPQRAVKNAIADPAFPSVLASRITTIIGLQKLTARYKSFEQRRQLRDEHDIFLADERIVNRLPKELGKVFYKGTAKRPIPISLAPKKEKTAGEEGKKKVPKDERQAEVAAPQIVAQEIEKALTCIPVNLAPGHNISVRVGLDGFSAQQLQENVTTAATAIINKHVVQGWRNVKSIHIKTPTSAAVPIWLADEVLSENTPRLNPTVDLVSESAEEANSGTKRKRNVNTTRGPQSGVQKRAKLVADRAADKLDAENRRARLSAQKTTLLAAGA